MKWGNENRWTDVIAAAAGDHGIDVTLVQGLIGQESGFHADAVGDDGASLGLMQIQLATAHGMGYGGTSMELLDPAINLTWGCKYLATQIRVAGSIPGGLSAYNGGYRPWLGFGAPLASGRYRNQAYVDAVLANQGYFQQTYGFEAPTPSSPPESGMTAPLLVVAGVLLAVLFAWWAAP